MKNFIGIGDRIPVASMPEEATSGEFIKIGALFGVAEATVASGEAGALKRTGVFLLPKVTGTAWTQGMKLFWDASAKKFTPDSSKTPVNAVAWIAAGTNDTTGQVLLGGPEQKIAFGTHTTVTATDTIVTGLALVESVVACFATDPADPNTYVSATKGDQAGTPDAGSFILKTWKQSGSDPTPIAADAFSKVVNWIAVGR